MREYGGENEAVFALRRSIDAQHSQAELAAGSLHVAVERSQRQLAPLRELDIRGVIDRKEETIGNFERRIPGA